MGGVGGVEVTVGGLLLAVVSVCVTWAVTNRLNAPERVQKRSEDADRELKEEIRREVEAHESRCGRSRENENRLVGELVAAKIGSLEKEVTWVREGVEEMRNKTLAQLVALVQALLTHLQATQPRTKGSSDG